MASRRRFLVLALIFLVGCAAVAAEGRMTRLRWTPLGEAPAQAAGGSQAPGAVPPGQASLTPAPASQTLPAAPVRQDLLRQGEARPALRRADTAPGKGMPGEAASPRIVPAPGGPLDLNVATAAELEALPGIGPDLARRIIEYRQQQGAFRTVEELDRVRGIGPARLGKLRNLVRVTSAGGAQ